jgi:hypothetical protein
MGEKEKSKMVDFVLVMAAKCANCGAYNTIESFGYLRMDLQDKHPLH